MKIIKYRWIILALWVITTIYFTVNQPNMSYIISQKGENLLPDNAQSKQAADLLQKLNLEKENSLVLVFYDADKITDDQQNEISQEIDKMKNDKSLGVSETLDPFSTPDAKDRLISADGTTLIAQISYDANNRASNEIIDAFQASLNDCSVTHYITGDNAITNDYTQSVSEGVDKSAVITIVFILVILMAMFRSVVTPFVSLFAVGVSYLCSMGIVGILIKQFDFPVTNFTEMFILLVLFGIGTDYHILLLNRFKEELSHGHSVDESILISLKTAGKTILYSGMTVFIGFLSLSFVQFPVYRSANAVAIGIVVLLLEILTLTPVMMKLLSGKLFWPSHSKAGHKDSKFWATATTFAVKRPVVSLLLVAIVIAPIIIFNTTRLSFDSMADLDSNLPSIKGFHLISDKFGEGTAMPLTMVIENDKAMDNNSSLTVLDNLEQEISDMSGVQAVYGPTRPKGSQIAELYSDNQLQTVTDGIGSANSGIQTVSDGLNQINGFLQVPDLSQVGELANGSNDITDGIQTVTGGLQAVDNGIAQGADGATSLKTGIATLKTGVTSMHDGLMQISAQLALVQNGYETLGNSYGTINDSISQLRQLESAMEYHVNNLDGKLPNDEDVTALKAMMATMSQSLSALSDGMTLANTNYGALTQGIGQINQALNQAIDSTASQSELMLGITALENGADQLSTGLTQGEQGQKLIIENMQKLSYGSAQVHAGIATLNESLNEIGGQTKQLKDALAEGRDGLNQISTGLNKGNDYLTQLATARTFYIPPDAINSTDINKMLDAYMTQDRTSAKLTIELTSAPYSDSSMDLVDKIKEKAQNAIDGTTIGDAQIGISGATSMSKDMRGMATADIVFTQCIVMVAIFILLIIVTKSFWIPVYIVGSLIAAYYTALSITAVLSEMLFHNPNGMAWNVPFFAFIMIATLGVDYSIFLMERFREYKQMDAKEAIVKAAKNIGGVVISAAVILSGTFATLYPSNLVILMELAICVIIGLMLLCLVFLPVVIPALITLQAKIGGNK